MGENIQTNVLSCDRRFVAPGCHLYVSSCSVLLTAESRVRSMMGVDAPSARRVTLDPSQLTSSPWSSRPMNGSTEL